MIVWRMRVVQYVRKYSALDIWKAVRAQALSIVRPHASVTVTSGAVWSGQRFKPHEQPTRYDLKDDICFCRDDYLKVDATIKIEFRRTTLTIGSQALTLRTSTGSLKQISEIS